MSTQPLTFRGPTDSDAARIWRFVEVHGGVEQNSCYAHLLLCAHFADTCVIAEQGSKLVGFVLGYRPPTQPDQLFVWQVAVDPSVRGQGLGGKLLEQFVARPGATGARYLTATVSPDNAASQSLFHGFARRRGVPCASEQGFPSNLFAYPHPDEPLLRIGPLQG